MSAVGTGASHVCPLTLKYIAVAVNASVQTLPRTEVGSQETEVVLGKAVEPREASTLRSTLGAFKRWFKHRTPECGLRRPRSSCLMSAGGYSRHTALRGRRNLSRFDPRPGGPTFLATLVHPRSDET
eukprot:scaffold1922_cov59-Phaeocystis_antarctica.AAC.4